MIVKQFRFDPVECRLQVNALGALLGRERALPERKTILPFFRDKLQLIALMGTFNPLISKFDLVGIEFHLCGGRYVCDLVVGDSETNSYVFIELEDATPSSIYRKKRCSRRSELTAKFHRGFGQLRAWTDGLQDIRHTDLLRETFGTRPLHFAGLLVIGRSTDLSPEDHEGLLSYGNKMCPHHVHCMTYDDLHSCLSMKLQTLAGI